MKLGYEESDLDILLRLEFKKKGFLWWKELICNCKIIPLTKYGTEKITIKEIKRLEEYIFPYIKNLIVVPLISLPDKEGNYMVSISSKWEISKILNQFMCKIKN